MNDILDFQERSNGIWLQKEADQIVVGARTVYLRLLLFILIVLLPVFGFVIPIIMGNISTTLGRILLLIPIVLCLGFIIHAILLLLFTGVSYRRCYSS